MKSLKLKNVKLIIGGKNRQQSALKALKYLIKDNSIKKVLIHDVARPNFTHKLLNTIISKMKDARAVVPKIDINDAIKQKIDSSLNEYILGKSRKIYF